MRTLADELHHAASALLRRRFPLPIQAWDGSRSVGALDGAPGGTARSGTARSEPPRTDATAGPTDTAGPAVTAATAGTDVEPPVLVLRRPLAVRRLLYAPGELGLAEAYLAGDLDIDGDLRRALELVWTPGGGTVRPPLTELPALLRLARRHRILGPRPPRPGEHARLRGRLHTRRRDRAAIAHHYDAGNDFYQLLLDPTMAYSCGYYADGPDTPLARAQLAKLDLICRKLDLRPGRTLLDVGCGWGALLLHAAEHYDATVTGITLSRQQFDWVQKRIADAGLTDRARVIHADYRQLPELLGGPQPAGHGRYGSFDTVTSIEMGEHVGAGNYPAFARLLFAAVREGGRLLLQQMSRGENAPDGGAFIATYIAPDMTMQPLGATIGELAGAGWEIRDVQALREHYDWTVRAWANTLEDNWSAAERLIGPVGARVWRLYLAGGGLAFASGRMGVDQVLAVKPRRDGAPGMPPARAAGSGDRGRGVA